MKLPIRICAFLLCLAFVGGCGGSRRKQVPLQVQERFNGYVSGIVLGEAKEPLVSVRIKLTSKDYRRTAETGPSGEFVFSHLPLGAYTLEVGPPPEMALNQSRFAKFRIIQYQSIAHQVDLRAGQAKKHFKIKLKKGLKFPGVLYGPEGQKPAVNQRIYLRNSQDRKELFGTVTDSEGRFEFSGLKNQNYRLGYRVASVMGEETYYADEIKPGMLPSGESFTLRRLAFSSFAGRVKNQRDKLVANLKMTLLKQGDTAPAAGFNFRTDSQGRFLVERLLPGAYDLYLFPNSAAPQKHTVTLKTKERVSGLEFRLTEGGHIRGHIMNKLTKAPLGGLMLVLYGHDIFNRLYTETIFNREYGEFEFNNLLDGKYTIVIIDPKTMLELKTVIFELKNEQKVDDYVIELARRKGKVKIFKHRQGG